MAFFQHVGNTPFENERLNKRERGTYMDRAHAFKILLLILTCPAALHVFKPLSIFKTSGIDTLIVVTRTHNDE